MKPTRRNILLADDDPDDRMLIRDALQESQSQEQLTCVENGEELLDYLRHQGAFSSLDEKARPYVILLDLNMPRKDGREALREIKADPHLRRIPVIVLTTSQAEEDIARTYDLGASSFIIKPRDFETLVRLLRTIDEYWFETVQLPSGEN
ncbi:MAG TPA: response regulator [Verrucomicrobiae bacterium]|nr:response regulator [Verrucomicrobiae bacterium]